MENYIDISISIILFDIEDDFEFSKKYVDNGIILYIFTKFYESEAYVNGYIELFIERHVRCFKIHQ